MDAKLKLDFTQEWIVALMYQMILIDERAGHQFEHQRFEIQQFNYLML